MIRWGEHGACGRSSGRCGVGGALRSLRGRDVFAAFPDDLAVGEGPYDRGSVGDDLVWGPLDRATSGALQRARAFGAGRSAARQRRGGDCSEARGVGSAWFSSFSHSPPATRGGSTAAWSPVGG